MGADFEDRQKLEGSRTGPKMLKLVDIYYDALDAPKTGNKIDIPHDLRVNKYPHFMERDPFHQYNSASLLGKLYDEAVSRQPENPPRIGISPLTCFTEQLVTDEREVWARRYQNYLKESSSLYAEVDSNKQELNTQFRKLYQKYKEMLYDAAEFEESAKDPSLVFREACAIYQIAYERAVDRNDVRKCGFAWKVAGHALCLIYAIKRGGGTALCSYPVLRDAFKNKGRSA